MCSHVAACAELPKSGALEAPNTRGYNETAGGSRGEKAPIDRRECVEFDKLLSSGVSG
jgi:hypothetical protein